MGWTCHTIQSIVHIHDQQQFYSSLLKQAMCRNDSTALNFRMFLGGRDDLWQKLGLTTNHKELLAFASHTSGATWYMLTTLPEVAVAMTWMNDIKSKCGRFNAHVISWAEKNAEISEKCTVHDGRTYWWRRKGQCSSMSRLSEPWVDKCYVLWCPPFHMFNHDSQLVHVDEWWEPLSDAECQYDDRRDVTEMD